MIAANLLGIDQTEIGQAILAILVAVVGYLLHRKAHQIQVIVNGRTDALMARVLQLEQAIRSNGSHVPPAPSIPPDPAESANQQTKEEK